VSTVFKGQDGRVPTLVRTLRPTLVGSIYVLGVAAVSTLGFTTGSTPTILLAALLALPSSAVAVSTFYLAYGLLALVPGANPSSSIGTGSCAPNGVCQVSMTGDAAAWFTLATEAVGILALTAAALLNAVVLRNLIAARRTRMRTPKQPHH
jgi:hypothetical protein